MVGGRLGRNIYLILDLVTRENQTLNRPPLVLRTAKKKPLCCFTSFSFSAAEEKGEDLFDLPRFKKGGKLGIFGPKQCHLRAVQVLLHFHLTQSATFRAQAQYAQYGVQEL